MTGRGPHGVWFGELDLGPEVNFILLPLGPLDNGDSGECELRWVMRVFLQKLPDVVEQRLWVMNAVRKALLVRGKRFELLDKVM